MSGSAKVAMLDSYRSIVHTELNMVNGRTSIVWGEGDDAQLQQQLGHDAYLELMTSTEEALLRELEVDLAYLGGDDQTGEYEAYMAHQELMAVASVEEAPLQNEDRVLCPLCLRGSLQLRDGCLIVCDRWATDGGGCNLHLETQGHPSPLELLRERMCLLLNEHGSHCRGSACCRLPLQGEQATGLLLLTCQQCGMDAPVV